MATYWEEKRGVGHAGQTWATDLIRFQTLAVFRYTFGVVTFNNTGDRKANRRKLDRKQEAFEHVDISKCGCRWKSYVLRIPDYMFLYQSVSVFEWEDRISVHCPAFFAKPVPAFVLDNTSAMRYLWGTHL